MKIRNPSVQSFIIIIDNSEQYIDYIAVCLNINKKEIVQKNRGMKQARFI